MNKKSITVFALIAIFSVGWYLRFQDVRAWRENPDVHYVNGEPVLINADGFYYLSLAKDLHEGTYTENHQRRLFPDQPANPRPAPLISRITAWLHALTGTSFERLGMILPALFGPFLALAVFGVASALGYSRGASCAAGFLSVISIAYVERTQIGFFDTDFLIVTFASSAAALGVRLERGDMPHWVLAFVGVNLLLFLAWWNHATPVVVFLCIGPLVPALFQIKADRNRIQALGILAFACLSLFALIWGLSGLDLIVAQTLDLFAFFGQSDPVFPNTADLIDELRRPDLLEAGAQTTGHWTVFVASIVGFGLLAKNHPIRVISLFPLLVIACLSFVIGLRFLIFFAPITALGLSYLGQLCWQRLFRSTAPAIIAALLGIVLLSVPAFQKVTTETRRPGIAHPNPAIQAVLPLPQGLVWTSWTLGNPLLFHSAHRIIADAIGDANSDWGERVVYNYLPLATSNQRFAVNFMHFYAKRGFNGIRAFYERAGDTKRGFSLLCEILQETRGEARQRLAEDDTWSSLYPDLEDALDFFFPSSPFPIYLVLHQGILDTVHWHEYGLWSPDKADQTTIGLFYYGLSEEDGYAVDGPFRINLREGGRFKIEVDGESDWHQVSHILRRDARSLEERRVAEGGLRFEWLPSTGFGALLTPNIANSVLNTLYLRHSFDPNLFEPVAGESPSYQVWRVKPQPE
jgi:dolichyl-diphosphooligosaccharide--protein glycosyltransferase